MGRITRAAMNERKARMLKFLYETGAANGGVSALSYRTVARVFDITHVQARTALSLLQQDGLIEAQNRYLPNGAQLENLYMVTPKGADILAWLDERPEEVTSCPA